MTFDTKGVMTRPEAPRPGTATQATSRKLDTRLSPREEALPQAHGRGRRVYDATPAPRTPADVLPRPPGDRTRRPYPRADGKRLTESITDTAAAVIAAGSHEAERRDPDHSRPWIALIDVDSHQIDRINAEPHERKTNVTILIDLTHLPPARSVTWEVVAAGRLLAASVPGCGTGLVRVGPTRGRRPHCGTLY
jgi:hypothetical protein